MNPVTICWRRKSDNKIIIRNVWGKLMLAATPTEKQVHLHKVHIEDIDNGINVGEYEHELLLNLKWLHPHLPKNLKKLL